MLDIIKVCDITYYVIATKDYPKECDPYTSVGILDYKLLTGRWPLLWI